MKTPAKSLEVEHRRGSKIVLLSIELGGAYEASVFYEDLTSAALTGRVSLTLTTGELLKVEGPRKPKPWSPS